jgi:hypothetical protein
MKKSYLLTVLFIIAMIMTTEQASAQDFITKRHEKNASGQTQMRAPGVNPNPGSVWVNRDETLHGKAVTNLTPEEFVKMVLLGHAENSNLCF